MEDSITMAEVGSMVNVSGSRIATPLGPPSPGSTPTKMPSTRPTIISASVFHVSRTAKPCINKPKASMASPNFCHCEFGTGLWPTLMDETGGLSPLPQGEVKSSPAALSSQHIENQCLNSLFLPRSEATKQSSLSWRGKMDC